MSTAPQGWQTPKTNWQAADIVHPSDFNRIEGNIQAIESGRRTLDPSQVPSGDSGSLRQILSWFANRIRAITGAPNWWDNPPATLASVWHPGNDGPGSGLEADAVDGAHIYVPSNTEVLLEANTQRSHSVPGSGGATTSPPVKEFRINGFGTVRVRFEAYGTNPDQRQVRLYVMVGGSTFGETQSVTLTGSWATYNVDLGPLIPGAIIRIILVAGLGGTTYIRNVKVLGSTSSPPPGHAVLLN